MNNLNACTSCGGNRRLNVGLWLLVASLFCFGGAAAQTYTKQSTRFPRVQIETTFSGGTSTATAVKVTAFAESVLVNDASPSDVKGAGQDWVKVEFDLIDPALANTPITAAGVTLSGYGKLAALLRQAAIDRANASPP